MAALTKGVREVVSSSILMSMELNAPPDRGSDQTNLVGTVGYGSLPTMGTKFSKTTYNAVAATPDGTCTVAFFCTARRPLSLLTWPSSLAR